MGSPYPLHYTLRWPYYYMWPSIKNHCKMPVRPIETEFTPARENDFTRLMFCGDIMLTQKDMVPILHPEVKKILNTADLFIGNCEAPVGSHQINPQAKYHLIYHMPELFIKGIIDQLDLTPDQWVLSVANNHAGDKGVDEYLKSINILSQIGVHIVGHYCDYNMPLNMIESRGVKLGISAWTDWMNREIFPPHSGVVRTECIQLSNWREIKKHYQLDMMIGMPHWEYEFQHFPKQRTRNLAKKLINHDGFNLVIGAHPHTLQPMEWFDNGICAYSLGNFCGLGLAWPVRLIPVLEVKIGCTDENKGKILSYKLHTFAQVNHKSRLDIVPLTEINTKLRDKMLKRLGLVFHA